jgi:hypothetical protein
MDWKSTTGHDAKRINLTVDKLGDEVECPAPGME